MPELAQEELDVRAWEAVHGRKAQRGVFGDHWATDLPVRNARTENQPSESSSYRIMIS